MLPACNKELVRIEKGFPVTGWYGAVFRDRVSLKLNEIFYCDWIEAMLSEKDYSSINIMFPFIMALVTKAI